MVTKAWRLLRVAGHDAIFCLLCDKYSFNPQDVAETYCGYCHTFLHDVPMNAKRTDDGLVPQHIRLTRALIMSSSPNQRSNA